jgi:hypothetical protein
MFGGTAAWKPGAGVWGVEADRGSLWPGPADERESGCIDDEGRCVTK